MFIVLSSCFVNPILVILGGYYVHNPSPPPPPPPPSGNLLHKHKTVKFDVVGEQTFTK